MKYTYVSVQHIYFQTTRSNNFIYFLLGGEDANGFAPSFIEKPRIIPNDAGTLITMKCKCKAKPGPTVTWYRGQEIVTESSKISIKSTSIEENIYELILEIKVKILRFISF